MIISDQEINLFVFSTIRPLIFPDYGLHFNIKIAVSLTFVSLQSKLWKWASWALNFLFRLWLLPLRSRLRYKFQVFSALLEVSVSDRSQNSLIVLSIQLITRFRFRIQWDWNIFRHCKKILLISESWVHLGRRLQQLLIQWNETGDDWKQTWGKKSHCNRE